MAEVGRIHIHAAREWLQSALSGSPDDIIARALGKRGVHVPISWGYGLCGTLRILDGEQDARGRDRDHH